MRSFSPSGTRHPGAAQTMGVADSLCLTAADLRARHHQALARELLQHTPGGGSIDPDLAFALQLALEGDSQPEPPRPPSLFGVFH